jgi:hypothetical protein
VFLKMLVQNCNFWQFATPVQDRLKGLKQQHYG